MKRRTRLVAGLLAATVATPAFAGAQDPETTTLAKQLAEARAQIQQQQAELTARDTQMRAMEARLAAIEARLTTTPKSPDGVSASRSAFAAAEPVGQRPQEPLHADTLPDQGGELLTRKGSLVAEWSLDYAQANRSRALFRGLSASDAVLIGAFDINDSRISVLTTALGVRYGLSNRLEISGRLPFVFRWDRSVLTPLSTSASASVNNDTQASELGDGQLAVRYQLNVPHTGGAYVAANAHLELPTGRGPFSVARDADGLPLQAATGAGFWGVGGGLTVIVPSDPAALFASVDYLKNFGGAVDALVPPSRILRVDPGDTVSFSAGIGVAVSSRTSFNLGYVHSWVLPGAITSQLLSDTSGALFRQRADGLQIGRFSFGIVYRMNRTTSLNWGVEIGATQDAPSVRTTLRIPIILITGG